MDSTKLYLAVSSGSGTATVSYIVYGAGTTGGNISDQSLVCTSAGYNALAETNPDNYNFHSGFQTLKYFQSGSLQMSNISSTTIGTIPHNLGYTPFFVVFAKTSDVGTGLYAIAPFYENRSTLFLPNKDIAAFCFADSTNLYLKAWLDANANGTFTFNFYYKIFKNNLGL